MTPDYDTHDPRGWCGDPSRGAALGRPHVQDGDNHTFSGRLYLRQVPLNQGGYDKNGTYFGIGQTLYWCAGGDEDHEIDFVLRARSRDEAKQKVLRDYPKAQFFQ